MATRENYTEVAKVLISHGADINEKYENGRIALHIAAHENNAETADVLISHDENNVLT
ncbi:hypothetical protein TVAG_149460 [Trichomonas vaginalis G3]|uniref:Uncharacterized protein n=1 Tax=Trichomonas vaginalis (strain ATCC PRA-98 / G3) TaxID=412133 RepID=A2ELL3_TRIV3|nr:Ankyrin repeat family [Trichomonas vaginalis G3]EAY06460.1 hypothetical protein TVAG_149460 [Trichomonas vaginalis G3]KAI5548012.1 Ankyrin repeat family [Trichomonas vaginalis G3]|eukprot:XP_001318683.1 hypothetical protein [Trichomonas vaginalis G3]